jgi:hypothetical protein
LIAWRTGEQIASEKRRNPWTHLIWLFASEKPATRGHWVRGPHRVHSERDLTDTSYPRPDAVRGTVGVSPDAARLDIGQRLVLLGLAFFRTKLLTLESHTLAVSTSHSPGKQVHMKTCSSLPGAPDLNRPGLSFDHRRPQGYETNSRSLLRTSKFSATAVALPQRGSPALRVEHSLCGPVGTPQTRRGRGVDPRPRVFSYFRNGSRLTSLVRFHRSPRPR